MALTAQQVAKVTMHLTNPRFTKIQEMTVLEYGEHHAVFTLVHPDILASHRETPQTNRGTRRHGLPHLQSDPCL